MRLYLALLLCLTFAVPSASAAKTQQTITARDGSKMVLVPEGKFVMGSKDDDIVEFSPEHTVYLDAFYIDVHEITNAQFATFLNAVKPDEGKNGRRWNWLVIRNDLHTDERFPWWPTEIIYEDGQYKALEGSERQPVITVSWYAANEYCKWAGKRLPTEAEWEKAARGGLKKKRFPWGDEIPTGGVVFDRTWRDNLSPAPTANVGSYLPNGYGIYDMAGNVWEWCSDWLDTKYYKKSPKRNPRGPDSGKFKVLRGGSWYNFAMALRVAVRNSDLPTSNNDGVGFRCAKDADGGGGE